MEQKQRDKKEKIKKYPTVPERWRIIICIWLKEIEKDSSVSAFSFLFNGEKLINFSATLSTDAEFVWGYYTKIVRDRFREGLLSMTLFWQKNKSRHSIIFFARRYNDDIWKIVSQTIKTRLRDKRIIQENRSGESFERVIWDYNIHTLFRSHSWVVKRVWVLFTCE